MAALVTRALEVVPRYVAGEVLRGLLGQRSCIGRRVLGGRGSQVEDNTISYSTVGGAGGRSSSIGVECVCMCVNTERGGRCVRWQNLPLGRLPSRSEIATALAPSKCLPGFRALARMAIGSLPSFRLDFSFPRPSEAVVCALGTCLPCP